MKAIILTGILLIVMLNISAEVEDDVKKEFEIASFFVNSSEIKKTPLSKLRDRISGFSDLDYDDLDNRTERLIPDIAVNIQLKYSSKLDVEPMNYEDHFHTKKDIKEIAQYHINLLPELGEEIMYYTILLDDEEEKIEVYERVKAKFMANKSLYFQTLASHWDVFRHLSARKLPSSNTDIMNYFGLLEGYIMLGDKLEEINENDDIQSSLTQATIATTMFEAISRVKKVFKYYKVSFLPPFLATYVLQESVKLMFGSSEDPIRCIDMLRLYSSLVQKEAITVNYTVEDLEYTIERNREALVKIFHTAYTEFDMPDVFLETTKRNYKSATLLLASAILMLIGVY